MNLLRVLLTLALVAVGRLLTPSSHAQGTIIHIVPSEPVNMFGIPAWPWTRDFDVDADGTPDYQFDNDGAVVYVSPLGSNRQIAYPAVPPDMGSYLTPLFAGEAIGASLDPMLGQWVDLSSPNRGWHSAFSYQFNIGGGGTFYGRIAYMGIDFMAVDGGRHFGWIKIDNSLTVAGGLLVEWAWATTPGEPILAGAVPEPSTWALLGVGALALLVRQRRLPNWT